MMDTIINFLLFVALFSDFFLAFLILLKSRREESNIVFSITSICIGLWTLGIVMFRLTDNLNRALFWNREFIFTAGIIPTTFLHFSLIFPFKKALPLNKIILIHFPNLLILVSVFIPDILIRQVIIQPWGKESVLGWGYIYFGIFFSIYMGLVYFNLLRSYFKAKGILRLQLMYVFAAVTISVIFGAIFNLYLILLGNYKYIWVGPYASFLLVFITSYAITKHRLMDIEVVIRKGTVYSVVVGLFTGIYLIAVFLISQLFQNFTKANSLFIVIPVLLVFAVMFQPVKNRVQGTIDKLFFKQKYDYQKTIRELSEAATSVVDLDALLQLVLRTIIERMKIEGASVYLADDRGDYRLKESCKD